MSITYIVDSDCENEETETLSELFSSNVKMTPDVKAVSRARKRKLSVSEKTFVINETITRSAS